MSAQDIYQAMNGVSQTASGTAFEPRNSAEMERRSPQMKYKWRTPSNGLGLQGRGVRTEMEFK